MKRVIALLSVLVLVGCAAPAERSQSPNSRDTTPIPSQKPPQPSGTADTANAVPEGLYPPDTRTGKREVDQVLTALAQRDTKAIDSLVKLSKVACTAPERTTPGDLRCPEGTADGTLVDAFAHGSCNINFFTSLEDARRHVQSVLDRPLYVYAINQHTKPEPSGAEFEIFLAESKEDDRAPTLYLDHQGMIVAAYSGCGKPGYSQFPPAKTKVLLAPKG
jgi:hypothetical protein